MPPAAPCTHTHTLILGILQVRLGPAQSLEVTSESEGMLVSLSYPSLLYTRTPTNIKVRHKNPRTRIESKAATTASAPNNILRLRRADLSHALSRRVCLAGPVPRLTPGRCCTVSSSVSSGLIAKPDRGVNREKVHRERGQR